MRLNLPTSVVITGIDSMKILDQALEAAQNFKPLTKEQVPALLARTASGGTGKYELFKTSTRPRRHGEESAVAGLNSTAVVMRLHSTADLRWCRFDQRSSA